MDFILYFFSSIVPNYVLYLYLNTRYNPKYNKCILISFLIFFTAIIASVNLLNMPIINLMMNMCLFYLYSYFFYDSKGYFDYIIDQLLILLIAVVDSFIYFILEWLYSKIIITTLDSGHLHFIKAYTASLVIIVVCLVIKRLYLHKYIDSLKVRDTIIYFGFPMSSVILLFLMGTVVSSLNNTHLLTQCLVMSLVLIILNLMLVDSFYTLNDRYRLEIEDVKKQHLIQLQEQYLYDVITSNKEIRKQIHDFKRHLNTIALLENGDVNTYISDLHKQLDNNILFNSQSQVLNLIIHDKINTLSKNKVNLNVTYADNLDSESISFIQDLDIVSIFTNLIDNAYDAVINLDKKNITLSIYRLYDMLRIDISNSCNNRLVTNNKKEFVSTKENHDGLGLSIIRNTVEKYDGIMEISINNSICKVSIAIPIPSD